MRPRLLRSLAMSLLFVHATLLIYGAWVHAPTLNEPQHLVKGLKILEEGRFDFEVDNTPLVFMVAAFPVVFAQQPADSPALEVPPACWMMFGEELLFWQRNGTHAFRLFTIGRLACIPFSLLGGYICYRWSRELYGSSAGVLALTLWSFSPNIIAHGQVITGDMGATALGTSVCYAFWKWLKQPNWRGAVVTGLLGGLAALTKFAMATLFVALPLLWILWRLSETNSIRRDRITRDFIQLTLMLVISFDVINAGYGFTGSFRQLRDISFQSEAFAGESEFGGNRFSGSWLGAIPVPLPVDYVRGFDRIEHLFDVPTRHFWSYLRGQWSPQGWWYFYLYSLLVKVPLGIWVLAFLAIGMWFTQRGNGFDFRDELYLLWIPAFFLAIVSSRTGFTHHLRYILPLFPFFFVWIGKLGNLFIVGSSPIRVTITLALTWSVASSLWVYPHSLSYFNELAGGPRSGHNHLVMSNIDWGQDLFYLKKWLNEHPHAEPIGLAYYGPTDPNLVGIDFRLPPEGEQESGKIPKLDPGIYAISVNFLRGIYFTAADGLGGRVSPKEHRFSYFRQMNPVARAGYSIYIFRVDGK